MSAAVQTPSDEQTRRSVLKALRASRGRVTVGDVVAATGLARDQVEPALRALLTSHEGHLEVTDDGELLYLFDPKLVLRDDRSAWEKFKEQAWAGFKAGFKVWIMLMLVVYFVIYVTLAIAAFVALMSQNRDSDRGYGSRRGGFGLPIHWLFYLFWTPDWHYGSRYYGDSDDYGTRRRQRGGHSEKPSVPFYKKVFAYVFGPDEPVEDAQERDARFAQLIRARRGALTATELVEATGLSLAEAESEMGRLMGAFEGEVEITDDGELVYTFPELMRTAEGAGASARELPPAWSKLEVPRKLTGNTSSANTLISFFNGFNLLFALISPAAIFPILNIYGVGAEIGLVYVPLVFSLVFFAVPLLRTFGVSRENRQRHKRNVRRLVLKSVFGAGRAGAPLKAPEIQSDVERAIAQVKTEGSPEVIVSTVRETAAEFDAEIDIDERSSAEMYAFPAVSRAYQAAEAMRKKLRLDQQKLGEVVYSSADSTEEAEERELKEFEKDLAEAKQEEEDEVGYRH